MRVYGFLLGQKIPLVVLQQNEPLKSENVGLAEKFLSKPFQAQGNFTIALTNVTLPYVLKLADLGWKSACKMDESLKKGLNIVEGEVVYKEIMESFNWEPVLA